MDAKDILRIALFLLVAIFALRSSSFMWIRRSAHINNPAETEDTETHQLLQQLQDNRDKINQEPLVYENQTARKEVSM